MKTRNGTSETKRTVRELLGQLAYESRRRVATWAAIAIAFFLAYHVIAGQNGLSVYQQKRIEDRELQKQILELQQENGRLKDHVDHLKSDPDAIEHEARAILHYTRPGEVIYTLNDPPTPDAKPATRRR